MNLDKLQEEMVVWQKHNFPTREPWCPIIGMQEELGELSQAFLKSHQGIRGTKEEWKSKIGEEMADVIIYMSDAANALGINLQEELDKKWAKTQKRDWILYPMNGRTE